MMNTYMKPGIFTRILNKSNRNSYGQEKMVIYDLKDSKEGYLRMCRHVTRNKSQ